MSNIDTSLVKTGVQQISGDVNTSPAVSAVEGSITTTSPNSVTLTGAPNQASIGILISGTWTGTLHFQGTIEGGTWEDIEVVNITSSPTLTTKFTISNGTFIANGGAFAQFRILGPTSTGTANIAMVGLSGSDSFSYVHVANAMLNVSADQGGSGGTADPWGVVLANTSGNELRSSSDILDVHVVGATGTAIGVTFPFHLVGVTGFVGATIGNFPAARTRSDTFTTTSNGTTVDASSLGCRVFSLSVVPTGAVTSWDVRLEGSIDNSNFTTILQHTNVVPGSGVLVWSGVTLYPTLYFRSRCAGIVLGAGTNVVATIAGLL